MGLLPAEGEEALMLLLGERAEPLVGSVEKKNQAREVQAVWPVSKEKKIKAKSEGRLPDDEDRFRVSFYVFVLIFQNSPPYMCRGNQYL